MPDVTSPDGITAWQDYDPADITLESQAQAASIQAALGKRQRYDFVWANSGEQAAETRMVQGSRGYQVDTRSEFIYDFGSWRLSTPYQELQKSSNQSIPNNVYTAPTNWTLQTSLTTDQNFVTVNNGVVTFALPGIYNISMMSRFVTAVTAANAFSAITATSSTSSQWLGIAPYTQQVGTVQTILRTGASNTSIYLWVYQNTGAANNLAEATLRILRQG